MVIKNIIFTNSFKYYDPSEDPDEILGEDNIENSNIDVFVELDNEYTYRVVIATAKNLQFLMEKQGMNYFKPGLPVIIVKKLTPEIIKETLLAYDTENGGYWLKLYLDDYDTIYTYDYDYTYQYNYKFHYRYSYKY
jgi:hypothetical protein